MKLSKKTAQKNLEVLTDFPDSEYTFPLVSPQSVVLTVCHETNLSDAQGVRTASIYIPG